MIKTTFYQIGASLVRNIGGNPGRTLRRAFYELAGVTMGKRVIIHESVTIYRPYNLTLGDDVGIGVGTVISANEKIKIRNRTTIGPGCSIYDNNHIMPKVPGDKGLITDPIEMGEDSWISAHSIILKGVTIGNNVTVGAGSVVHQDVPDDCVVLGNPARIIKKNESRKNSAH